MSFWSSLLYGTPNSAGEVPNTNPGSSVGPPDYNPGDPEGVELVGFDESSENRALPWPMASPWSGWPVDWSTPNWSPQLGINKLVDIAWGCIDLNSSVLGAMPVYRLKEKDGRIIPPTSWMANPDPTIYTSWQEFCKQLMWDYMLGEAFVLPMARGADTYPLTFRVIPPWLINVEMKGGSREYKVGSIDVTDEVLHIRYSSTTDSAHGVGPLELAGARMTAIRLLQRYADRLAETGGIPLYWMGLERRIQPSEARDLLDTWIETRTKYAAYPAVVGGGATLNQAKTMSAQDMSLLELSQFNESRIAVLLGVPPFLMGLPGSTGSLTYANTESLYGSHDRSSLRPKANAVMSALSQWALPGGQSVELNRDEYTRPNLLDRANAYKILIEAGVLTADEARVMERLYGESASVQLSGGAN